MVSLVSASRSLPDLSTLTASSEEDDLSPTEAPPSPRELHSRSPSGPGPCTPSRSPSPWDEKDYLERTPNGRRHASSFDDDAPDLPDDLRNALGTPKGSYDSGRQSRSRSESPMSLFRDQGGHRHERERTEDDDDDERDPRRRSERTEFTLHHPGPSEFSIHSAPADFDSPAPNGEERQDYADSPSSATSPSTARIYESRRGSNIAFRLPFSLFEYLQVRIHRSYREFR